jgi:hypothetical protein
MSRESPNLIWNHARSTRNMSSIQSEIAIHGSGQPQASGTSRMLKRLTMLAPRSAPMRSHQEGVSLSARVHPHSIKRPTP